MITNTNNSYQPTSQPTDLGIDPFLPPLLSSPRRDNHHHTFDYYSASQLASTQ